MEISDNLVSYIVLQTEVGIIKKVIGSRWQSNIDESAIGDACSNRRYGNKNCTTSRMDENESQNIRLPVVLYYR